MGTRIPRIDLEALDPELGRALAQRVERLGYLGEFFRCAAHQPKALRSFVALTEDLKEALPDRLTEVVALTVAGALCNDYERNQHERLCRALGFADEWTRAVGALAPEAGRLDASERLVQRLALDMLAGGGRGAGPALDAVVGALGPEPAIAVLMLVGRYVSHSLMVNALDLAPPVPSIFADDEPRPGLPLWIAEADVARTIDLAGAIAALEAGLRAESRGEARNLGKTHVAWDGGTLHAIGAVFSARGLAGAKTWAHTGPGATPLLVLYDSRDGTLRAVIEAFALGQLRTAAASGVATRCLAAPDAADLAIVGSGKQALPQVAAVAAVRPLRRVRVFSPNPGHRARLAARIRAELSLEAGEAPTVEEAVRGAAIVTLATRARAPFLTAAMVERGAHLNAIGAITPDRAEVAADVVARSDPVVADDVDAARRLARELADCYGAGEAGRVKALSAVVAAGEGRPAGADLTLFKAMGMGISDLALAAEVYDRAMRQGLGRPFPHPRRVEPRLRPSSEVP